MYNPDTEFIFPPRLIPLLRTQRGEEWRALVDTALAAPPAAPERVAFVLIMARLSKCASCKADTFWGLRGCTACVQATLQRLRLEDRDLIQRYKKTLAEITS
ncbi:MAG: hypothetical protein OHK0052_21490 [Anaerolineales bacterium]